MTSKGRRKDSQDPKKSRQQVNEASDVETEPVNELQCLVVKTVNFEKWERPCSARELGRACRGSSVCLLVEVHPPSLSAIKAEPVAWASRQPSKLQIALVGQTKGTLRPTKLIRQRNGRRETKLPCLIQMT